MSQVRAASARGAAAFQPPLLDRLTDDHPHESEEPPATRSVTVERLRRSVLRDLSWLLNTSELSAFVDLSPYPLVAGTSLNFGVRSRCGRESAGLDPSQLRRELLRSMRQFEPRIVPHSLEISVLDDNHDGNLHFRIEADLRSETSLFHMSMRTELAESAGTIRVVELRGE